MAKQTNAEFLAELEAVEDAQPGEVMARVGSGVYVGAKRSLALEFLAHSAASASTEQLSTEQLNTEQLTLARSARKIAITALIVAIVSIAINVAGPTGIIRPVWPAILMWATHH